MTLLLAGCEEAPTAPGGTTQTAEEPAPLFMPVYRDGASRDPLERQTRALHAEGSSLGGEDDRSFYIALHKRVLEDRWFLSAYMRDLFPGTDRKRLAAATLGTRVVSFRVQNGKLFVFDVDDRRKQNDVFDSAVIVEAYPIVRDPLFDRLPRSSEYVVFDPAAGLNRFGVLDDYTVTNIAARFEVELAFSRRFRPLADGVSFEQIFTGYTDVPSLPNASLIEPNRFRASGLLGISLRRYQEGKGYVETKMPARPHYFTGLPRLIPDTGRNERPAAKWNIQPGMKPIRWLISPAIKDLEARPAFAGMDLYGAIERGVERWNEAFGFEAFEAVMAAPTDSFGDDEKNFIVIDIDSTSALGRANFRVNPNNGEIRGASVYLGSGYIEQVEAMYRGQAAAPAQDGDARADGARGTLTWLALPHERLCDLHAEDEGGVTEAATDAASLKERVEGFLTRLTLHEVGHTLGLRHNFKGSLLPVSSSVMEYSALDEAWKLDHPGPYDTAAIRHLYGLSTELPTQPFCTDGEDADDPLCARRDKAADPLREFHGPAYLGGFAKTVAGDLSQFSGTLAAQEGVLTFVKAAALFNDRRDAWITVMSPVKAPLPAEAVASPLHLAVVDATLRTLLSRLYPPPPPPGVSISRPRVIGDLPADARLLRLVIADLSPILLNVDGVRGFPIRRAVVDVFRRMQNLDAYLALREARHALIAARDSLSGPNAALQDDLIARVDKALNPYFDN